MISFTIVNNQHINFIEGQCVWHEIISSYLIKPVFSHICIAIANLDKIQVKAELTAPTGFDHDFIAARKQITYIVANT